jgi:hypothetical protein
MALPSPASLDPVARLSEGVGTLERNHFALARNDLLAVASQCADDDHRRRAMLLLAAAELDTGNAGGSPSEAARLAGYYMRLGGPRPDEVLLARALYRVATHLETLAPIAKGSRFAGAAVVEDPTTACPDLVTAADQREDVVGPAEAPWLLSLEARAAAARQRAGELEAAIERIAELEAEIERITGLLTSGSPAGGG